MTKLLATLTALALLLAAGFAHGLRSERWEKSEALEQAAARVADVPLQIGDWKGQEIESDAEAFAQAGARGYWTRTYTNFRTGAAVQVILMCGRAGKMSIHTPEVCYRGAGYEMFDAPAPLVARGTSGDELGTFWAGHFTKRAATTTDLRLLWGWNADGTWHAPANPRWEFRGRPFLYKLYVSHGLGGQEGRDAAEAFLPQLLPELRRVLFAPEAGAGT